MATNDQRDEQDRFCPRGLSTLSPGLILVGLGALFLLDNLHIVRFDVWWPVILIAFGTMKLVDAVTPQGRVVGGGFLAAGGVILAHNLGYLRVRVEDLWPLLLIAAGLFLLWERTRGGGKGWWEGGWWDGMYRAPRPPRPWKGGGYAWADGIHDYAVFGMSRRVINDPDFKAARLGCVFGAMNVDLTQASMVGSSAVLTISTVYGGATVRIPPNWNLEIHAGSVFGGFDDRTIHPPAGPDMKHLIVRGGAVFSGVTFKN